LTALESKLVSYVKDTTASAQPLDVSTIPKISRAQAASEPPLSLPGQALWTLLASKGIFHTSASDCGLGASVESLKAVCDSIIDVLNMEPFGGTEVPTSSSVHTLQLSALAICGGRKVLVLCRVTFSQSVGVTLELGVRAEKQDVCQHVVSAAGG
ncbi:hypothetical protein B0H12DRAFT_233657, partial [Mycena haematopus]